MKKFQNKKPVIAIDGTAASGKGTLSKKIANFLNFDHLDTGLLYRFIALKRINGENELVKIDYQKIKAIDLTNKNITKVSSLVARENKVRRRLLDFQRSFANSPPSSNGSVIDGRDIGTVVIPNAEVKFFIDADIEVRAKRRFLDHASNGENIEYEFVLQKLKERDHRDKQRKNSPLIIHKEAVLIDSTYKTPEECLNFALKHTKMLSK